jgi:uncharacterized protein (TIGR03032 family)
MDVASGEVITRGLSMPHSPRWYGGRLWVCEAGAGTLGFIDPNTRQYVPITEVPGFTRGLDFAGNLAFVGLSQVRENVHGFVVSVNGFVILGSRGRSYRMTQ